MPAAALAYATSYNACPTVYDLSGNSSNLACIYVTTGSSPDLATTPGSPFPSP